MEGGESVRRMHVAAFMVIALAGCSQRRPDSGFDSIRDKTRTLIGHDLTWHPEGSECLACVSSAVQLPGAQPLSLNEAVELALINNPSLQATYEELGLANADVMAAGIFKNPVFSAAEKFPDQSGM